MWSFSFQATQNKQIFQIEVNEPYPELNGGQNIRRAKGPVHSIRYIYYDPPQKNNGILTSLKYEM